MTATVSGPMRRAYRLWRRTDQLSRAAVIPRFRQISTSEPIVNKRLDGKVAIITGASGGIGAVTAKLFASHGAQVVLADIHDQKGQELASKIGNTVYRHCDVSKEEDLASTVDFAVEKFGKLDIMYNNAGLMAPLDKVDEVDLGTYDRISSINVRGVLAGIKQASRAMIPHKTGVILTTASVAAVATGAAMPLIYNITKSSLPGLTRVAAYHLGKHGIRVNVISPHAMPTQMMIELMNQVGWTFTLEQAEKAFTDASSLHGRRCTEDDVANAALFLCNDESGFITGQNLILDGGWVSCKEYNLF